MMTKVYKCPENIEDLEELEQLIPMCRKELCLQAEARIESGTAKSIRNAAIQLAEETGRNPESIRKSIIRARADKVGTVSQLIGKNLTNDVIQEAMKDKVLAAKMTGDAESYTPKKFIELAREVMGSIDTDPASNEVAQRVVKAKTWYSKEDDGLTKLWDGNIFLNPPYSHGVVDLFVKKLLEELNDTKQAILLTNNNTDTKWFHSAAAASDLICFTKGRINFYKEDGSTTSPTNGQCFFYFGNNRDKFITLFLEIGGIAIWS